MGFILDYLALLLKYFPSIGYDRAWAKFPMNRGYSLIAAARTHDGWLAFSGVGIADGGYIKQSADKLARELKEKAAN